MSVQDRILGYTADLKDAKGAVVCTLSIASFDDNASEVIVRLIKQLGGYRLVALQPYVNLIEATAIVEAYGAPVKEIVLRQTSLFVV